MDILNNFTNSNERDIIISLPKDKTWLEYLALFMELKKSSKTLEIVLESLPKTQIGRKCYFIYDNTLRGHMIISDISENEEHNFVISLVPYLFSSVHKVHMEEIEEEGGFKYYFDNSNTQ
jgi:hypothetical protein